MGTIRKLPDVETIEKETIILRGLDAAEFGHFGGVKETIEAGMAVDAVADKSLVQMIHYAGEARNSNIENYIKILDYLLEQGADINARDDQGETPLHWASWNLEAVKLLISRGADRTLVNQYDVTPVEEAAGENAPEVVEYYRALDVVDYDKMKIQTAIDVLKEVIANGDYRMGYTGLLAGAHYGELKKKLKELQIQKEMK